jgi:hypothetical protein
MGSSDTVTLHDYLIYYFLTLITAILFLRVLSSGIKCCIVWRKSVNIMEEHITSIFDLAHGSYVFLQNVGFHQTIRHYISEDRSLHSHCCENLKSTIPFLSFYITTAKIDIFSAES